jgi:uncharacterized protein (TIGR02246 family)
MQARSDHHETRRDPADERAVRELFEKLLEDWARGDGEAYGSRFTEDADYVAFDGTRTKGREEISSSHQQLFDKFMKGTRLTGRIEGIEFPVPGVALVHATGGTLMRGKRSRRRSATRSRRSSPSSARRGGASPLSTTRASGP